MARKHARPRAAVRKAAERALAAAHQNSQPSIIGDGVRAIAADVEGQPHPLPLQLRAPLIYVAEMVAVAVCERRGWADRKRADEVAAYVMAGLQERAVEMCERFVDEHFEAWTAAAAKREEVRSG